MSPVGLASYTMHSTFTLVLASSVGLLNLSAFETFGPSLHIIIKAEGSICHKVAVFLEMWSGSGSPAKSCPDQKVNLCQ